MIKNGVQSDEFEGGYWRSRILPSVGVGGEESLLICLQKIFYLTSPLLCKTPPLTLLVLFPNPWRDCLILLILQGFQARNQDFIWGGANETKVDQTTEMYILLSDPFI